MSPSPAVAAPTLQLLAWIAERERTHPETIEAWKTSCPRFAVWEDALVDDLVRIQRGYVSLTPKGEELLTTGGGPKRPADRVRVAGATERGESS
jgi:hypothetical protein